MDSLSLSCSVVGFNNLVQQKVRFFRVYVFKHIVYVTLIDIFYICKTKRDVLLNGSKNHNFHVPPFFPPHTADTHREQQRIP
jgi:hypothetical protein